MIKLAYKNLFEHAFVNGSVGLDDGTAETDYPLYRVYDRNISRVFKSTAAETITIKFDQGASGNIAADRLLISPGHNLNLEDLSLDHSPDDAVWTPAITPWTGDSGLQNKSWASITRRYWRFVITSPSNAVEIPEIFITQTYEFEKNPARPVNKLDDLLNVIKRESAGGQSRSLIQGSPKKRRNYILKLITEAQKVNLDAFYADYAGAYPFYLQDLDDEWIYGELTSELNLNKISNLYYNFNLNFQEVIA